MMFGANFGINQPLVNVFIEFVATHFDVNMTTQHETELAMPTSHHPPIPFVAPSSNPHTQAWIEALRQAMPDANIVAHGNIGDAARAACTVAIVANPDPMQLLCYPKLRLIHSVWAGVERLLADLADTPLKHVPIARLIDPQLADTMAEAVLAWTLYLHRDMPSFAAAQAQALWRPLPATRAAQRTVGVLGLGALGSAAANRLLGAGFKVCGWSRRAKSLPGIEAHFGDAGLVTVLSKSNILVCLLPLTPGTRALLDASRLALMPPHASIINFARGPIFVDSALREALNSGQLKHAVLDVFDTKPLPQSAWQWSHPSVTVLPHISATTDRGTASAIVAAHVERFLQTGELPDCVDVARGY